MGTYLCESTGYPAVRTGGGQSRHPPAPFRLPIIYRKARKQSGTHKNVYIHSGSFRYDVGISTFQRNSYILNYSQNRDFRHSYCIISTFNCIYAETARRYQKKKRPETCKFLDDLLMQLCIIPLLPLFFLSPSFLSYLCISSQQLNDRSTIHFSGFPIP